MFLVDENANILEVDMLKSEGQKDFITLRQHLSRLDCKGRQVVSNLLGDYCVLKR